MPTRLIRQAAAAQRAIESSVQRALLSRWVDGNDDLLAELVGSVFGPAADLSQLVATEHYNADREANKVPGAFRAEPPGVPDPVIPAVVIWARNQAVTEVSFKKLLLGTVQHKLADASREVVLQNTHQDPRAQGWQRVVHSDCVFCRMIASNGAVYTSGAARFAAHDNCGCTAACAWSGRTAPVKKWDESKSQMSRRLEALKEAQATGNQDLIDKAQKRVRTLEKEQAKVRRWIAENPDVIANP